MIRFPTSGAACALCLISALASGAAARAPTTAAPALRIAGAQMAQVHDRAMPVAVEPAAGSATGSASAGPVRIEGAYVRASLGAAPNSAAYMTLGTTGAPDRLIAVSSPVAKSAGLHTQIMDRNNVMRMRPVDGIPVAPGETTLLKPGGLHVMLMGLTGPLKDGETIPLTLTFEKAGKVTFDIPVRGLGAMRDGMNHSGGHMP
jgi:hypothetical protein